MQIVVDEGGSVEFTRKPHLLDLLHPADRKRVERMTDITFNELKQRYGIKFLRGPWGGLFLRWEPWKEGDDTGAVFGGERATTLAGLWALYRTEYNPGLATTAQRLEDSHIVYFDTYEQAVEIEVDFVEFLRDKGYSLA